jgi:hypothetical protein
MKTRIFQSLLAAVFISASTGNGFAQEASKAPAAVSAPPLSYGVPQIVQLTEAKVSDDTIIAYIKNSGNSYGLNAEQIIYLRQQGVSEAVVKAMLNQPKNLTASSAAVPQPSDSQVSTAVAQPTVTYETVPSSTVYVMPDTQAYNYDAYYYQPYYYPYYAVPFPAVSFSFGFGHDFHGHGFHGGGFRGGDFHGRGGHR